MKAVHYIMWKGRWQNYFVYFKNIHIIHEYMSIKKSLEWYTQSCFGVFLGDGIRFFFFLSSFFFFLGCSCSIFKFPDLGLYWCFSCRATPQPHQCQIWTMSVTYTTAHSNPVSLTQWVRPGIEPASSRILVGLFPLSHNGNSSFTFDLYFLGYFCGTVEEFGEKIKLRIVDFYN